MMAATFHPDLLITHNAGRGWPIGLRAHSKQDVIHSLHLWIVDKLAVTFLENH